MRAPSWFKGPFALSQDDIIKLLGDFKFAEPATASQVDTVKNFLQLKAYLTLPILTIDGAEVWADAFLWAPILQNFAEASQKAFATISHEEDIAEGLISKSCDVDASKAGESIKTPTQSISASIKADVARKLADAAAVLKELQDQLQEVKGFFASSSAEAAKHSAAAAGNDDTRTTQQKPLGRR